MRAAVDGLRGAKGRGTTGGQVTHTVTINNTGGAAKTNYPVKVSLTSANFNFAQAASNGGDVRFTIGGSQVPHWIQSWDPIGQTGVAWVKVPSIAAGGTVTATMLSGDGVGGGSDGSQVFTLFDDFTSSAGLTGTVTSTQTPVLADIDSIPTNPILTLGPSGAFDEIQLREQADVLYDPAEPDPSRRYKFYYTGVNAGSTDDSTGVAFASNPLGPYTKFSTAHLIDQAEDPFVVKVGSTYHLWNERRPGEFYIDHYTSTDGVTWTADPANPVLGPNAANTWENQKVASPTVLYYNSVFYLIYEAIGSAGVAIGVASSPDGSTFTRLPNGPIVPIGHAPVPDFIVSDGAGGWVLGEHGAAGGMYRWRATADPSTWSSTSFTAMEANWLNDSFSANLVQNTGNSVVTWQSNDQNEFFLARAWGAGSAWSTSLLGSSVTSDPRDTRLRVKNSELVLQPEDPTLITFGIVVASTAETLTSNFEVIVRKKQTTQTATERSFISIGSGGVSQMAVNAYYGHKNSYVAGVVTPGAAGNAVIRKFTGANSGTILTSGVLSLADATSYQEHKISYLSTGALKYTAGALTLTATDTTWLSGGKGVAIVQGQDATDKGSITTVDWVLARPYDGVDPAVTVSAP